MLSECLTKVHIIKAFIVFLFFKRHILRLSDVSCDALAEDRVSVRLLCQICNLSADIVFLYCLINAK